MDWWLVFAVFLYVASALLIIAEVFVPSGGLLTICAVACLAGGVVIFFQHSPTAGWAGVVIAVVLIPTTLVVAYRIFPKTKFGQMVMLRPRESKAGDAVPDSDELKEMLGAEGKVVSPLRPVGMVDFAGERLECVAEGGFVEKDKKVKVVRVQSTQLTVRVIEET